MKLKYLRVEKVQFAILCIVKQPSWTKWHAFLTQCFCSSPSSFVPPHKINMPVEKKRQPYFSSGYEWRFEEIQMPGGLELGHLQNPRGTNISLLNEHIILVFYVHIC